MTTQTATSLYLIGANIRRYRAIRNLTQKQLAKLSGVPLQTISKIETGKSNATISTLVRVADALGCYLEMFLTSKKEQE